MLDQRGLILDQAILTDQVGFGWKDVKPYAAVDLSEMKEHSLGCFAYERAWVEVEFFLIQETNQDSVNKDL